MSKLKSIIELLDKGFRPYTGNVPEEFYREKRCLKPEKAEWMVRPWSEEHKLTRYLCLGCKKQCLAIDPAGWQTMLPIKLSRPGAVVFAPLTRLSVDEMLNIKRVLRVDEAAFALNISKTQVHELIQSGDLDVVPGTPTRVTSASVAARLEPAM